MEAFDPSMFGHLVFFRELAQADDDTAGTVESFPAPLGLPLPCRVRFSGTRQGRAGDAEISVTPAQVAMPADPGARRGDVLQTADGRLIRALGPARARDADGSLWVVSGEVID